jgi:hypothetical protein
VRIPIADLVANSGEPCGDLVFSDHFSIDANTLAITDEVRGGEESCAITLDARDGIDHRANRTFPIRAGNVNDALRFFRDLQFSQEPGDVFEPELDPKSLGGVKPPERFLAGGRRSRRRGLRRTHDVLEK